MVFVFKTSLNIFAPASPSELPVYILKDKTEDYNISDLLAGTEAFLRYGKTDLLVEYWERANIHNPKIDRIIYAIRNIDAGISLCDIADIERGIRSLRSVIKNDLPIGGETSVEKYIYGDAPLWQPSYFIATTGTTVMEKVREYIDSQKTDEHRRKYEKTGRYSKKRRR